MRPHTAHEKAHQHPEGPVAKSGYPRPETVESTYDDTDLDRAVLAYRFFYPTVSGMALWKGGEKAGCVPNEVFGTLDTQPRHVGFTYNSDTPYGPLLLDLRAGPLVIELAPGPLIVVAMDINQRWVADMGVPGPDAGKGGKHLLLPPGYKGAVPPGYHVATSTTFRVIVGARALPEKGDVKGALERLKTIKVYPLKAANGWTQPRWFDQTPRPQDTTPLAWEDNLDYWKVLHEALETEPLFEGYAPYYGELAALGIIKGKPFAPDARHKKLLEEAARIGKGELCTRAFADRRPDRIVWSDRRWEWAALRAENGNFMTETYLDLEARDKWFYQAVGASPAMFRRAPGLGSLYWLGVRDKNGNYLDGAKSYELSVPRPVPAGLFWSVTVYDADTRSQIQTKQENAALRSMFELEGIPGTGPITLHFGPHAPRQKDAPWIQTLPGKGWFVYFRIYGPEAAAFDGSWKPGDFTLA